MAVNDRKRPKGRQAGRKPGRVPGQARRGAVHDSITFSELDKLQDTQLRLVRALIAAGDWRQLKSRTGIDQASEAPQTLPLFIELTDNDFSSDSLHIELTKLALHVPQAYFKERQKNKKLARMAAGITLKAGDPSVVILDDKGNSTSLDQQLANIIKSGLVARMSVARSHQPCLQESLQDIGLLPAHGHKGHVLKGNGVIIGIIDDGCAFAHRHFLKIVGSGGGSSLKTRVLRLWDQSGPASVADQQVGWTNSAQGYGREIDNAAIDLAIAPRVTSAGKVEEDVIYAYLNYQVGTLGDMASHGTHVMDIACGNGKSLMGWEGVASEADIIFVQVPPVEIDNPGPVLDKHIVDGVAYILQQAGTKPVAINISFGGYSGPHDGTSDWESHIDALLAGDNRAVVVSAGNGFEEECHAGGRIPKRRARSLGWIVKPVDPTPNDVEIWYDGAATLTVSLTEPETGNLYGPYALGTDLDILRPSDNKIIGHVVHSQPTAGGDKTALVALQPTGEDDVTPGFAPAQSGVWKVTLRTATTPADFHAWVQRDDVGRYGSRRQQSRFVPEDAFPGYTIGDLATGQHTIAVGAYNTGTQEVSRFSACGPTRPGANLAARRKPDICAPAAEDAAGRGVLSASSLRAQPTRFGGTSASAPHVTGLVALVLEYSTKFGNGSIGADAIRNALAQSANNNLKYNRHQEVDDDFKVKQRDVWQDLIGGGKVDFSAAMNTLFP